MFFFGLPRGPVRVLGLSCVPLSPHHGRFLAEPGFFCGRERHWRRDNARTEMLRIDLREFGAKILHSPGKSAKM